MLRRLLPLVLGMVQAAMFLRQCQLGFVPGRRDPQRVPLSWDMFATPVERCNLLWEPPVQLPHLTLDDFSRLQAPLEWQVVMDRAAAYRDFARASCAYAQVATRVRLHCHLPTGTQTDETLACP